MKSARTQAFTQPYCLEDIPDSICVTKRLTLRNRKSNFLTNLSWFVHASWWFDIWFCTVIFFFERYCSHLNFLMTKWFLFSLGSFHFWTTCSLWVWFGFIISGKLFISSSPVWTCGFRSVHAVANLFATWISQFHCGAKSTSSYRYIQLGHGLDRSSQTVWCWCNEAFDVRRRPQWLYLAWSEGDDSWRVVLHQRCAGYAWRRCQPSRQLQHALSQSYIPFLEERLWHGYHESEEQDGHHICKRRFGWSFDQAANDSGSHKGWLVWSWPFKGWLHCQCHGTGCGPKDGCREIPREGRYREAFVQERVPERDATFGVRRGGRWWSQFWPHPVAKWPHSTWEGRLSEHWPRLLWEASHIWNCAHCGWCA